MGPSNPSLFSLASLSCLLLYTTQASAHAGSPYQHEDTHHHRPKRGESAASGAAPGDDGASNNNANGPSLSIPTWTVAATGAGTSYAQACDSESATYDNILSYGITPTGLGDVYTTSWMTTTSYTAPTTRLCDERIRVVGSLTPVHVGSVLSKNVPTITYTGPAPSCSVQPSDCSWLRTSYLAADSSFSAKLTLSPDAAPGLPPIAPRCYIPGPPLDACGQCTIHGGKVELLYFPLSTKTSRDMCATAPTSPVVCPFGPTRPNDDTVAGFATAPCQYISTQLTSTTDSGPSTVVNGTTLFSNRAYISYDTLYATNSCGRVGGTYSNGLVTVASSDVYSVSGYHFMTNHAAYSFNFADLAGPVPASAYLCQATCGDSGSPLGDGDVLNGLYAGRLGFCSTMIDDTFRPRLAVPPQMRHIDPQFENWYVNHSSSARLISPFIIIVHQLTSHTQPPQPRRPLRPAPSHDLRSNPRRPHSVLDDETRAPAKRSGGAELRIAYAAPVFSRVVSERAAAPRHRIHGCWPYGGLGNADAAVDHARWGFDGNR
jgi:hypothetical protein